MPETRARARWLCPVVATCALLSSADLGADAYDLSMEVSQCLSLEQETDLEGMDLRLQSACSLVLRCELRWRVICDGESHAPERARFTLAPGEVEERRARAAECQEGWRVTDIVWECHGLDGSEPPAGYGARSATEHRP